MSIRRGVLYGSGALLLLGAGGARAATTVYTTEASFLAAVAGLGVPTSQAREGFDVTPWGADLFSILGGMPAPSVSNLGLTWVSRVAGGYLATSTGSSVSPSYEMYATDASGVTHPNPDGFRMTLADATKTLYAVGGWFQGNMTKVTMTVDGDPARVDFTGGESTVSDWTFLGFVESDPALGFRTVEFVAADEVGGEQKMFFADSFIIVGEPGAVVPVPAALPLLGSALFALAAFRRGRRR
jgi:hypothetical protein